MRQPGKINTIVYKQVWAMCLRISTKGGDRNSCKTRADQNIENFGTEYVPMEGREKQRRIMSKAVTSCKFCFQDV